MFYHMLLFERIKKPLLSKKRRVPKSKGFNLFIHSACSGPDPLTIHLSGTLLCVASRFEADRLGSGIMLGYSQGFPCPGSYPLTDLLHKKAYSRVYKE